MRYLRRSIAVAVALALLGALTGCTSPFQSSPLSADQQRFDRDAAEVIAFWPSTDLAKAWATGFVPLQPLTIAPPDAELTKVAQLAIRFQWGFTIRAPEPPPASAHGKVVFADGSTMTVPLEPWPAARTLLARRHRSCARTDPQSPPPSSQDPVPCALIVTSVRLGTTTMLTSRGPAVVPAWLLTTTQSAVPIPRVAIPLSAATTELPTYPVSTSTAPSPASASDPPYQVPSFANDWLDPNGLISIKGNKLTFYLSYGSCGGGTVHPLVYETPTAVVIGGTVTGGRPLPAGVFCGGVEYSKPETVTLAATLGVRPLLNIGTGFPVYLGTAPGIDFIS